MKWLGDIEEYYRKKREDMVKYQIESRGVKNPRVLEAMRKIPRHLFVPEDSLKEAYEDYPLPIGYGQTISQPYMVACMVEIIDPQEEDRVLEIGTGSGYETAVLAYLVKEVYTIEIIRELQERAKAILEEVLGFKNIYYKIGDGSQGWEEYAPYDKIIVSAAAPVIPPPLLEQLKAGGIMVLPLGERWHQELVKVVKKSQDRYEKEYLFGCSFVPLVGKFGFKPGV